MQPYRLMPTHKLPPTYSTHEALSKLGTRVCHAGKGLMGHVTIVDLPISYSLDDDPTSPTCTVEVQEPLITIAWDPPYVGQKPTSSWTWEEYQHYARELQPLVSIEGSPAQAGVQVRLLAVQRYVQDWLIVDRQWRGGYAEKGVCDHVYHGDGADRIRQVVLSGIHPDNDSMVRLQHGPKSGPFLSISIGGLLSS